MKLVNAHDDDLSMYYENDTRSAFLKSSNTF